MAGKYRAPRHGIGGMGPDLPVDSSKLLDAHPAFLPNRPSKGSCAKWSADPGKNSQTLIRVSIASRLARQTKQAQSEAPKVTWVFELASVDTKEAFRPPKRTEMDEATAALKNKSIKELGLYWRRAPY